MEAHGLLVAAALIYSNSQSTPSYEQAAEDAVALNDALNKLTEETPEQPAEGEIKPGEGETGERDTGATAAASAGGEVRDRNKGRDRRSPRASA